MTIIPVWRQCRAARGSDRPFLLLAEREHDEKADHDRDGQGHADVMPVPEYHLARIDAGVASTVSGRPVLDRGEIQPDDRASGGRRCDGDAAAMVVQDLLHQIEPKTST